MQNNRIKWTSDSRFVGQESNGFFEFRLEIKAISTKKSFDVKLQLQLDMIWKKITNQNINAKPFTSSLILRTAQRPWTKMNRTFLVGGNLMKTELDTLSEKEFHVGWALTVIYQTKELIICALHMLYIDLLDNSL